MWTLNFDSHSRPAVRSMGRFPQQGDGMRLVVSLLALLLASSSASGAERIALICLDEDAAAAGGRQQRLERRLRNEKELRTAAEAAVKLAPAAKSAHGQESVVDEILLSAREAYWSNDLALAESGITSAASAIDAMGSTPSTDRATILLWRAALLLAKGDNSGAQTAAERLLTLAPDAKVDLDVFPPSFAKLVEKVRVSLPAPVSVHFVGMPAGARLWIDGRPAAERWSVARGSHLLRAEAAGFRSIDLSFEAKSDFSIEVGLPLALKPELERTLLVFAAGKEPNTSERTQIWEILFRINADTLLVIARVDGGLRARLFRRGESSAPGAVVPATSDGEKSILEWAISSLASSENRAEGSRPVRLPYRTAKIPCAWAVQGGLGISTRAWAVEGAAGGRFAAAFSGVGPMLSGKFARLNVIGEVSAALASYGLKKEPIKMDDGSRVHVGGGSTIFTDIRTGYRFRLGGETKSTVVVLAGGSVEHHQAQPLEDSVGDVGLLPSWDRASLDLGARAEVPLMVLTIPAVLSFNGRGSPWSRWRTSDALGSSPTASPEFAWGASLDFEVGTKLVCGLAYDGHRRALSFEGTGKSPLDPPLRDAKATEQVHVLQVTIGKEF